MEGRRDTVRFQQFVDFVPDATVVVGPSGAISAVNAQTEALFGYTREELIGRPVETLIPDLKRRPVGTQRELSGVSRDGVRFPALISRSGIETDDGIYDVVSIHDVTEQRRGQRRFEQLVDQAPDAIVGADAHGKIVLVNAQAEALFGYSRDELLGADVDTLVPLRYRGIHPGHRETYFADPRTRPMGAQLELFGLRKDGGEFPCEISLSSIEADGGPQAIAAIRDMSERIQAERRRMRLEAELEATRRRKAESERRDLEEQLNQLRRLESVGQLAGGIAHDFNNILGVILNYSQFVSEEIGEDSPAQPDVLEIRRAAERAAALTRQLLIFSRREVVRKQMLDLDHLIAELDRLLRRALGEHVELQSQSSEDLWPVEADPGQVEQVLVNLAVNARDAMPRGGRLRIETGNVEIDESYAEVEDGMTPGRYVILKVSDTGHGMDPEVAAHAFEPFFTTKPRGQGTGLGLTTVFGIVGDAGGYVRIDSTRGVGTTVRVYLPASRGEAGEDQIVASHRPAANGERVLVVEDEEGVREVTRRILEQAGYAVRTAVNGREALDLLRAGEEVDLVLTDVVMPEMLGSELAEHARELRPDLDILFMSGYIQQMLGALGPQRANTVDFIEKPFTAETLLVGVRNILDRREAAGSS